MNKTVVAHKMTFANGTDPRDGWLVKWEGLHDGDLGAAVSDFVALPYRSIQVAGEFGLCGTLVWEGSNDGVNFYAMKDGDGMPLKFDAPGLGEVFQSVLAVRPNVTNGDETTALTVVALFRGARG